MKLNDNEIRDINRHLEAGKPLPEKYRFLLFEDKKEVELVWNGKTGEVCNIVLPFQVIEQVDEPRAEENRALQMDIFDQQTGRQITGWNNKLIWGDNKLILSSLKNGPLREEIEAQGGIKLIYIDPPFDVGADFSMDIEIGGETLTKKPNVLEEIAYRDTWGKGADSFISMIYERLVLMRDLLADDGSIYVHCDWRVNSYIRLVLDEIFGKELLLSEIIWKRSTSKNDAKQGAKFFGRIHDTIHHYAKNNKFIFNTVYEPYSDEYVNSTYSKIDETGKRYKSTDLSAAKGGGDTSFLWKGCPPPKGRYWAYSFANFEKFESENRIYYSDSGKPYLKQYLDEMPGVSATDLWVGFPGVTIKSERIDYPTQKPEALIERIIKASSNEGDIVADFFCGSGTMAAVAEKLNRKWICSDLGKFAIHTTRKRMIGVQRGLKAENKSWRDFEILNLDYSPIKGPEGNIEYLVYIRKRPEDYPLGEWPVDPAEVVERAHAELAKG